MARRHYQVGRDVASETESDGVGQRNLEEVDETGIGHLRALSPWLLMMMIVIDAPRALLILLCLCAAFVLVFVISRPNLDVMAVIVVVFLLFVLSLSLSLPPPPPLHLIILSIFLNNHNYLQDFLFLSILRIMLLYHYLRRHRLHVLLLLLRILSLF